MPRKHNSYLTPVARKLRKNMTREERRLWYDYLRNYPIRFLRQKIIGSYIADFYCREAKIVIEVDGSQHFTENGIEEDKIRTKIIETYGLKVIRFDNLAVNKNFKGVCEYIDKEVQESLRRLAAATSL